MNTWCQSSCASLGPRLTKVASEVQTPRLPIEDFQIDPHAQALKALGIEGKTSINRATLYNIATLFYSRVLLGQH